MSTLFGTQLEPFEEHQSPSPNETTDNPYETSLAQRSTSFSGRKNSVTSPSATVNTLHRQLSGDPESPPPAWKRRPSVTTRNSRSPTIGPVPLSPPSASPSTRSPRSPSESSVRSRHSVNSGQIARRHPNLTMTTASSARNPLPMPNGMFLHESPNGSSTSLSDHADLALPNPAFRRRAGGSGSNRSSIASSQDLSALTSEELWALGHEQEIPDMSNPTRQAAERPLDTVRRMSKRLERGDQNYYGGLPGDVIWPAAPPVQDILPDSLTSKSFVSVASLGSRKMSKRGRSRHSSIDVIPGISAKDNDGLYMHGASTPGSPAPVKMVNGTLSSAHSSTTSLASQGVAPNKSFGSLSRPPSTYYSRDFLSSLAPREGGYAIAAQMGGGLGAHGTMSVEERRRSTVTDDGRSKTVGSRAPLSKSAGMGRWSLDGGENYGRPYATPSANTTTSNLSGPPITSAEPSPPANEAAPPLPDGALSAVSAHRSANPSAIASSPPLAPSTTPPNPSPLSQQNNQQSISSQPAVTPGPTPAPAVTPASAGPVAPQSKKTKKQLAKEAKTAEKAEAVKLGRARAEAARAEALKKQAAKEEAKRKEKEEKERKKAEKKAAKQKKSQPVPVLAASKSAQGQTRPSPAPPANSQADGLGAPPAGSDFAPPPVVSQQTARTGSTTESRPVIQPKRSFFGTLRKRLSYGGSSSETKSTDVPPVPKIDPKKVAQGQGQYPSRQLQNEPSPVGVPTAAGTTADQMVVRPPRGDSLVNGSPSPVAPQVISGALAEAPASLQSSPTPAAVPHVPAQHSPRAPSSPRAGSPAASPVRKRNSVVGPRPMPEGKSRPTSLAASSADHHAYAATPGHVASPGNHDDSANEHGMVPVTPSTSGDSTSYVQSLGSHMTNVTPITSPSESEGGRTSEDGGWVGQTEPARIGSKDSNETVHGARDPELAPPIVA
ncbi:hypothetical protein IAU60_003238 [Kwoniella sp. DSM 27419]